MSEEIKKAYKLFNREDLIDDGYERDLDSNIQVFLTTKQMINYMNLQQKVEQLENIRKEAIWYLTSYESISTIQGLDDMGKNKNLDEKTMNEMINRYLKVHDILLNILNKGSDKE